MERYKKYKNSGVEWIGEIPVGWEVKRFRYVFDLITDKVGDNLPKIGLENIESGSGRFIAGNTEFEGEGIHFLTGDILFGKLRPYLSKVYLADFQGKAVGDFFVFRGKGEINERFGAKLISSKRFVEITNGSTYGSKMPRVSWNFISELPIAYPDIEEQTAIANLLDRKTAEIDELIAQKERLLALYEEEKTAIINHAVTKGLDPNAELKNSGENWLGKIPTGWEVVPIKFNLAVPVTDGPHETPEFINDGVPFISAEAIKNDRIDFGKKRGDISWEDHHRYSMKYKPKIGDVYMVKSGATTGNLARVETDIEFNIWSPLAALRPKASILLTDFLYFFMKSRAFFAAVELGWNYGTQQNIGMNVIENLRMVRPPKREQASIVQYIETETARINAKIAKTQRIIELQKEYHTALISEVVTGKIKVPELSIQETTI